MLGGFKADLEDLGFDHVMGVVFLRRQVDYKISHYREFTLRQGNKVSYEKYLLGTPGVFDYLFLIRNFKAIFGTDLRVIDFSRVDDTVSSFFEATGLSELLPGLSPVDKANVKPAGVLGVEAMRHANRRELGHAEGLSFLSWLAECRPELFEQDWTERDRLETFRYGLRYRRELAKALDWPDEAVETLLEDSPITGRPVAEAQVVLEDALREWTAKK